MRRQGGERYCVGYSMDNGIDYKPRIYIGIFIISSILISGYLIFNYTFLKYYTYEPGSSRFDLAGPMHFDKEAYIRDHPELLSAPVDVDQESYNKFIDDLKSNKDITATRVIEYLDKRGLSHLVLDGEFLDRFRTKERNSGETGPVQLVTGGYTIDRNILLEDQKVLDKLILFLKAGNRISNEELLRIFDE
jgi:hypothetical protein